MATSKTRLQIWTKAQKRADFEQLGTGSVLVDAAEGGDLINDALADLWELLAASDAQALVAKSAEITSAGAVLSLPTDFYRLHRLDVKHDGEWCRVEPLTDDDQEAADQIDSGPALFFRLSNTATVIGQALELYPPPTANTDFRIRYIFEAPILAADVDPLVLPNQWFRWVEFQVAVWLATKEEDHQHAALLAQQRDEAGARIMSSAKVTDRSRAYVQDATGNVGRGPGRRNGPAYRDRGGW